MSLDKVKKACDCMWPIVKEYPGPALTGGGLVVVIFFTWWLYSIIGWENLMFPANICPTTVRILGKYEKNYCSTDDYEGKVKILFSPDHANEAKVYYYKDTEPKIETGGPTGTDSFSFRVTGGVSSSSVGGLQYWSYSLPRHSEIIFEGNSTSTPDNNANLLWFVSRDVTNIGKVKSSAIYFKEDSWANGNILVESSGAFYIGVYYQDVISSHVVTGELKITTVYNQYKLDESKVNCEKKQECTLYANKNSYIISFYEIDDSKNKVKRRLSNKVELLQKKIPLRDKLFQHKFVVGLIIFGVLLIIVGIIFCVICDASKCKKNKSNAQK